MNITPDMRYFAVARMTRQLEKMADNYDIHQLHDHRLSDMAEEIERMRCRTCHTSCRTCRTSGYPTVVGGLE